MLYTEVFDCTALVQFHPRSKVSSFDRAILPFIVDYNGEITFVGTYVVVSHL